MVYNTTANAWVSGTISFTTKVWPNDTVVFTPDSAFTPGANYLCIATGYDAATGGTQSKVFTWNFTVGRPQPWTISGVVTAKAEGSTETMPLGGAIVTFSWNGHEETVKTAEDGSYTWTHSFDNAYDVTIGVDPDDALPPGSHVVSVDPPSRTVHVTPLGGTSSGMDFLLTYSGLE
jgi:hypothetical protein